MTTCSRSHLIVDLFATVNRKNYIAHLFIAIVKNFLSKKSSVRSNSKTEILASLFFNATSVFYNLFDNLKVHTSEETKQYLATVPGRFEFVFTPKHGSWLNMVEGFFSKMTRQMLRGIRVESKEELRERIYKYFEEVNREPVVYRWKYRLDEVDVSEDVVVDTLPLKQSS